MVGRPEVNHPRIHMKGVTVKFSDLTKGERSYLAMHARYEAERQQDPRYWIANPDQRARRMQRWFDIAEFLTGGVDD